MKDRYTIREIADLYGIGTDSLRYYEKLGLIHPGRGTNGYRLYSLRDIYRLTIIRDLRQLGFHTAQIRDYLDGLSLEKSLSMYQNEQELIQQKKRELEEVERPIEKRMELLNQFKHIKDGTICLSEIEERPCVRFNTDIRRDEEFDFAIKKLHHMHNNLIRDLGIHTMGAAMAAEDLDRGLYGLFRSVFFVLPKQTEYYDFLISGGEYARLYYRGSYKNSGKNVKKLRSWVKDQGFGETEEILEIYHIDNRYTAKEEEFLTELQMKIRRQEVRENRSI